ncbi:DUF1542 domain-containing protein, partial [Erysipelothrix rhusiopathiae]|nr:DUF1542 domain-containing protein [Erysipelothrix rhusiopathiae]
MSIRDKLLDTKNRAKNDLDKKAEDAKKEIDKLPNLTDDEKQKAKDDIEQKNKEGQDEIEKKKKPKAVDNANKTTDKGMKDNVDNNKIKKT